MPPPLLRPRPPGSLRALCGLAGLVACLALVGCRPSDPLAAIREQQAAGDFAGSIEPLRALLSERPDDPEANFLYGRALVLTQQVALATWSLRKAMEDPAWFAAAATQLAYAALGARDFNEVVSITTRILEKEPDNVPALLMRANAHAHWKKDPALALVDADRVLELDPNRVEAYEPRILALIDLDRREEANEALAEAGRLLAKEQRPPELLAWHCVTTGVFAQEGREIARARETFDRCVKDYPSNLDAVQNAVGFHDAQGERERSLEILQAALAQAPNSRPLRLMLVERLRAEGDVVEAEARLREAAESENPGVASNAWLDLGKFRQSLGDHAGAAQAMERAVERAKQLGPPPPQLEFTYADTLVLAGRLDDALEVAQALPVPAQSALIRARVAQSRGEAAKALEEFDAALRLWPDNPWARYYAALAAEQLGDFGRAIEEYRYSIRINATATDARIRAARLLQAERKPLLAIQLLTVKAEQEPLPIEGQLLFLRLSGMLGDHTRVHASLKRLRKALPAWVGRGAAQAAEGVALRGDPGAALELLDTAPELDLTRPVQAAALESLVRFAHEAAKPAAADARLRAALDAHPKSGAFHALRGLHLELSGSPPDAVRTEYRSALELEPQNATALAGLGRLALADDPRQALDWFERAANANPGDPDARLGGARALVALGEVDRAAERLDALLRDHPYEARAAAERARLDLDRGVATAQTLERARRAVRFGGGAEALDLLSRVHAARGESEPSLRAAERARELRASGPDRGEAAPATGEAAPATGEAAPAKG